MRADLSPVPNFWKTKVEIWCIPALRHCPPRETAPVAAAIGSKAAAILILPRRGAAPPDSAAMQPQLLTRVNFRYRFMKKFVAFLQQSTPNQRGKPHPASLAVALGQRIRIVR
jgi:hypothetical protein